MTKPREIDLMPPNIGEAWTLGEDIARDTYAGARCTIHICADDSDYWVCVRRTSDGDTTLGAKVPK